MVNDRKQFSRPVRDTQLLGLTRCSLSLIALPDSLGNNTPAINLFMFVIVPSYWTVGSYDAILT